MMTENNLSNIIIPSSFSAKSGKLQYPKIPRYLRLLKPQALITFKGK